MTRSISPGRARITYCVDGSGPTLGYSMVRSTLSQPTQEPCMCSMTPTIRMGWLWSSYMVLPSMGRSLNRALPNAWLMTAVGGQPGVFFVLYSTVLGSNVVPADSVTPSAFTAWSSVAKVLVGEFSPFLFGSE